MSLEVEINLNSLKIVREEIEDGIAQSATEFEAYLANQEIDTHLAAAEEKIAQIGGTFRLLEYPGAALLADEMSLTLKAIADVGRKTTDALLKSLTHAYFVLPRYIEFVAVEQKALPILVLPYVNEMRAARKDDLLPEYHFFKENINCIGTLAAINKPGQIEQLLSDAKRLSHMYQTGFVGLMREPGNNLHYQYSLRALNRIVSLLGDSSSTELLRLAAAALSCMAEGKLELTFNRKHNLASIEKLLRSIVSKGETAIADLNSEHLTRDFLFMLMLSNHASPEISEIKAAFSLPELKTSDDNIVEKRNIMQGPNQNTLETVIKALSEELRSAKDVLEISAEKGVIEESENILIKDVVTRVADTLGILNLEGPKVILLEQVAALESYRNSSKTVDVESFQQLADAIIYVESALSSLDRRETTVEKLNEADHSQRSKIIADSYLAEAKKQVIEEAKAGINLVKRAISSYVDANYDSAHIANVAVTLDTVRGGLQVLNYARAAAILTSCAAFVTNHIKVSSSQSQHHQLLDTLADTLISLEYYLNEVEFSHRSNDKILDVAEESLAALGFPIEL